MIKAKKIGLILDREVQIDAVLKSSMIIGVACQFIDADYDRLYLRYPDDKIQLSQYFYEGRTVDVSLDTLDGRRTYPAKILYEPANGIIVVEYYEDDNVFQKRKILRVRATRAIDVKISERYTPMLTIDISGGGCRILSPYELKNESIVDALLRLIAGQPQIKMKLKVLNSQFLPVENKYEISVEFFEIRESDRKKIMKFCYDTQAAILLGQNRVE